MSRICVIGDSHLAVLAFKPIREALAAKHEMTYFTAHLDVFTKSGFDLIEGVLVPRSEELAEWLRSHSGGKDRIVLDDYDRFIVIGLGFSILAHVMPYALFNSDSITAPHPHKYLLSDAAYVAAGVDAVDASFAFDLVRLILGGCEARISVVPAPNPGLGLDEYRVLPGFPPVYQILRDGQDEVVARHFAAVCATLAEDYEIEVLAPLPEVAANGVFMQFDYCELAGQDIEALPNPTNEMVHGNEAYGWHLIARLFAELRN